MDIEFLRNLLREDVVSVNFTKKDGSNREMLCTLLPQYLPDVENPTERIASNNLVTAWDLEAEGWRSFRFDTIKSVYTDEYQYVASS